jgi:hypothetical protein
MNATRPALSITQVIPANQAMRSWLDAEIQRSDLARVAESFIVHLSVATARFLEQSLPKTGALASRGRPVSVDRSDDELQSTLLKAAGLQATSNSRSGTTTVLGSAVEQRSGVTKWLRR